MSNIREEKGYTYGISAGIMFYPDSGLLAISTETDNEYVEPLIQEVYHEIDRLHQEPVVDGRTDHRTQLCWAKCAVVMSLLLTFGCIDLVYCYFRSG